MMDFEALKTRKLAIWLIGIPFLVAVLYYSFLATDRYVSTAQVAVRETSQTNDSSTMPGLALMLSGVNPTSREETLYLREFILSSDMLNVLQEKLHWSDRYAGRWWDPLYWLRAGESRENILSFYQRVVTATFNEETGLVSVQVEAFDPELAQQTMQVILAESERFVNEISHRMARDQMSFSEGELANARKKYEDERAAMLKFQAENDLLDPENAATSRAQLITELESTLIKERARLKALQASLQGSAPQVQEALKRIRAIEQQLVVENQRLVSSPGGDKLNVVASQFRDLMIAVQIAEETYKVAITAVESARMDATKKLRSLVTVVSPNLPEEALYPERLYNLATILIVLLLLYGIARFVIATIEDHRD